MPLPRVSDAIDVTSSRLAVPARRALAAIDAVHRDPGLPRITLDTRRDDPRSRGHYRVKRNSGKPVGIGVDPDDPTPDLVVLHEIAHFLDHQALGRPGRWASPRDPALADWRRSVHSTATVHHLASLLRLDDRSLLATAGGTHPANVRAVVSYLLSYTELWARSYVQYIAQTSRDPILIAQTVAERHTGDLVWDLAQWPDDDFDRVSVSIAEALAEKGWLT